MKYLLFIIFIILFSIRLSAQCVDSGNYWIESWVSCTDSPNPNPLRGNTKWLMYEFHNTEYIDSTHIWNANRTGESGYGIKDVVIDHSIDGTTWIELGTYSWPQAPETMNYQGFEGPEFNGVPLTHILITVLSTHDNGNCASISELQLKIDKTACYGTHDICGICNGPGELTWYSDADGDGFGDPNVSLIDCNQPNGFVLDNSDLCDNGNLGWSEIGSLFSETGCTGCHGSNAASGLDLRTYNSTSIGGNICGPTILIGTRLVDIITISGYNACGQTIAPPAMNDRIGGQLTANDLTKIQIWVDGGAPENCIDYCSDYRNVELDYYSGFDLEHQATIQIDANNTLYNGSNIIYDSGQEVQLSIGFEAQAGAEFLAKIGGCN